MRYLSLQLLAIATVTLTSCATLDRAECEAGDWEGIGYRDGAAGFRQTRLDIHTKACARHAIAPDETAYQAGFGKGLYDFCIPHTGYRLGLKAEKYHYLCPVDTEAAFLVAYADGLERTLAELNWRYSLLDHRFDLHRYAHRGKPSNSDSDHSHRDRRYNSADDALDDLRFEQIRVRGLLNRARRHLRKLP